MTQDILRNLARAKAAIQAYTIGTFLTEGFPMTHEHTANEEARHGNRDALEQVTRERDRLREALENARRAIRMWKGKGEPGFVEVSAALHGALRDLDAALEDKQ